MTASLYRKYNAFSNRESAQTEKNIEQWLLSGFQTMYTSIDYGGNEYNQVNQAIYSYV